MGSRENHLLVCTSLWASPAAFLKHWFLTQADLCFIISIVCHLLGCRFLLSTQMLAYLLVGSSRLSRPSVCFFLLPCWRPELLLNISPRRSAYWYSGRMLNLFGWSSRSDIKYWIASRLLRSFLVDRYMYSFCLFLEIMSWADVYGISTSQE